MKRPVPARDPVSVSFVSVPTVPAFSAKRFSATFTLLSVALALAFTLAFFPATASAATPAFTVGAQVATTGTANIRATADGKLVGTQSRYSIGYIAAGPSTVSGNSTTWYQVSFISGPSGWLGADMLIGGVPTPTTTVVGNGSAQTMILDELGNIDVAFTSSIGPNNTHAYSLSESTNQGLTFSTPNVLPALASTDFAIPAPTGPQLATERSGAIDLVYTCPAITCPAGIGNPSVQMIRSTDHGVTWSAPIQISLPPHPSESGADEPVIAACGAGVTIAWQDDGVGSNRFQINPDIFVVQVLNGVPGAPLNVTNTAASEGHPQIAVNPQSTIYLTWVSDNANTSSSTPFNTVNFAAIPNCAAGQN